MTSPAGSRRPRFSPQGHRAQKVYQALLDESAETGLATVYRVRVQFVQAGPLLRTHFEIGRAVFELDEVRTTTT